MPPQGRRGAADPRGDGASERPDYDEAVEGEWALELMGRPILALVGMALLFLVPFLFLGGRFEQLLAGDAAVTELARHGGWAWLAGLGLLIADLLLPIPATGVMAALGVLYGPLLGGVLAALGATVAGAAGYLACRLVGRRAAQVILGAHGLAAAERRFRTVGPWLVALSRPVPLLPELVACVAGLVGMPPGRFFAALLCGTVPLGFGFAGLGAALVDRPGLAFLLATVGPLCLWLVARRLLARSGAADPALSE